MPKETRRSRWPYEEFNRYLNELMAAAGIPLSKQGTPNTVVFEDLTGIDPGRVSRWRQGLNQPTVESLRQIAEGLAPRLRMDTVELLVNLEVKAGRRSEAEARSSGVPVGRPVEPPEPDLDLIIQRVQTRLDQRPPSSERRELELRLARARRARDAQRLADELMAEVRAESDPVE